MLPDESDSLVQRAVRRPLQLGEPVELGIERVARSNLLTSTNEYSNEYRNARALSVLEMRSELRECDVQHIPVLLLSAAGMARLLNESCVPSPGCTTMNAARVR